MNSQRVENTLCLFIFVFRFFRTLEKKRFCMVTISKGLKNLYGVRGESLCQRGAYDEDCKIEVFDFTSWVPAVETAWLGLKAVINDLENTCGFRTSLAAPKRFWRNIFWFFTRSCWLRKRKQDFLEGNFCRAKTVLFSRKNVWNGQWSRRLWLV